MNRAVAIEVGDIGGPNHGIFWPSGSVAQRLGERGPARAPAGQQSARCARRTSRAAAST